MCGIFQLVLATIEEAWLRRPGREFAVLFQAAAG